MKRNIILGCFCLLGLASCKKQEIEKQDNSSIAVSKYLPDAKSVVEAKSIIDEKVAEYSKDYDSLCKLTNVDKAQVAAYSLKNYLGYLSEDCLELNDINMVKHRQEIQDYYYKKLKEKPELENLLFYGRVDCFENRDISINPN